jgi:hypothetical protein
MAEIKRGALQSKASTAKTSDTVVRHVQIVDAHGNVQASGKAGFLVLGGADGVDTNMPGMYYIDMVGSGDATFVFPVDANTVYEIIDMKWVVDSAVTLTPTIEAKALGASNWPEMPVYTYGTYAADGTSQLLNSAHPLRHMIAPGNEYRAVLNVSGACKVGLQVMAVEL